MGWFERLSYLEFMKGWVVSGVVLLSSSERLDCLGCFGKVFLFFEILVELFFGGF